MDCIAGKGTDSHMRIAVRLTSQRCPVLLLATEDDWLKPQHFGKRKADAKSHFTPVRFLRHFNTP